jgi:adenosylhomocysteine nucleosidase
MSSNDPALLLIASEAREFRGILRNCGNSVRLNWPVDFAQSAVWNRDRVVMVANGPGFRLASKAAQIAGEKERFRAVVSTGFCGGLDPELQVGDIVEVSSVIDVDSRTEFGCETPGVATGAATRGSLASVDRVAETSSEKAELRARTGASAVEMEAAAVARFAASQSLPFYCLRVISDTAGHSFDIHLNDMRDQEGRFAKGRIVLEALRRPWSRIPGLIRLDRACKLAEDRLGEFFVNCNFA